MKHKNIMILLLGLTGSLFAETVLDFPFDSRENTKGWMGIKERAEFVKDGDGTVLKIKREEEGKGSTGIRYKIKPEQIAGKRVTFSTDIKRDVKVYQKWQGAKFMITVKRENGKMEYFGIYFPPGKFDWTTVKKSFNIPQDIVSATLFIGIQSGSGEVFYRNLKIFSGDLLLDFEPYANMGYVDEKANDGKGGWSDQGPDNDASKFNWKRGVYANVPFKMIDPARNDGKSVLTFRNKRLPQGLESVTVDVSKSRSTGKYLYLFSTLTFPDKYPPVGDITVKGEKGEQKIQIVNERDTANWWGPMKRPNAFPGALWYQGSGNAVGAYVSKFKLDDLGILKSVTIAKHPSSTANWIVLGVTISNTEYKFPVSESLKIEAGKEWKVLKMDKSGIHAGTVLDLSFLNDGKPTGTYGRVIINKDGHFAFSEKPDVPVRFLASAENAHTFWGHWQNKPEWNSHEKIRLFAEQLRRAGYNMVRIHFLDDILLNGAKADYDFNPKSLDTFDYLVYELGKNGIYINLDCMSSRLGYAKGERWGWRGHPRTPGNYKRDIFFDKKIRENWKTGVRKLLTHQNPYTKKNLLDDPTLAMLLGFNEQEFGLTMGADPKGLTAKWQEYLRKKYKTIDALKAAWGSAKEVPDDFSKIRIFEEEDQRMTGPYAGDVNAFLAYCANEMYHFYKDSLKEIGWNGPVTAMNLGKSFLFAVSRRDFDFVTMNTYHAHPSGFTNEKGGHGTINQGSAVGSAANCSRNFFSMRYYKLPYVVTEHLHVFWNKYRYEQGFITGALSAFQDLDGLTAFGCCVSVNDPVKMSPFKVAGDPILKAEEFLTAFLFLRGDVSVDKNMVRLALSSKEVMPSGDANDGMSSAQSKISLVSRFAYTADERIPVKADETVIGRSGGSGIVLDAWYNSVIDSKSGTFNTDVFFDQLRKTGFLPKNNRSSDAKGIYETSTGEILMDTKRNYMQVNTPRLQGICAEAKTKAKLADFEVREMSVRGNLAVVSIPKVPLKDSDRMVLVIATNALNNGIVFADREMKFLKNLGKTPAIIQAGKFTVALNNKNASALKVYALAMSGERIAEIPVKAENGKAVISIDTAKTPAIYFELTAK